MIKAVVDIGNKELKPKMIIDGSSYGQYAHELAWILDRIIIDEEIKESPAQMALSEEEQKNFIIEKRNWYLEQIRNTSIDMEYIHSDKTSILDIFSKNYYKFKNSYEFEWKYRIKRKIATSGTTVPEVAVHQRNEVYHND